jgi:putative DNA primase/helicase
VKCFGGCDSRELLAELRRRDLLPHQERDNAPRPNHPSSLPPTDNEPPLQSRIESVLDRSLPLWGTIGMTYLQRRGLDVELLDPSAVRFMPETGHFAPALVAIITAFNDAERVLGLQFTPLKPDGSGRSGDRYFLTGSRPGGGVVRLVNDAEVTTELGVCEGVETGLGAMTTMRRSGRLVRPIWAALSAYNMPKLAPLPGIERLIIYADNGAAGAKAAKQLAALWADGRDVFIAPPTAGDWNTAP